MSEILKLPSKSAGLFGIQSLPVISIMFMSGVVFLHLQPDINAPFWTSHELLIFLPLCLFLFYFKPQQRALISFFSGYLWALFLAHFYLLHLLPEELVGVDLLVQGRVTGIPESSEHSTRFNFKVTSLLQQASSKTLAVRWRLPTEIRLSWYYSQQIIKAGDEWQFKVRLKPPHGMVNPGGFDYEKWLYQKGIHATGYVRESTENIRLASNSWTLDALRGKLYRLIEQMPDKQFVGIVQALTIGQKNNINQQQWAVLRQSGTSHLMAISGLHIGLIAAMIFWFFRHFSPALMLKLISAQQFAAIMCLLCALGYALLAGFSVPTQRAFIMLCVVMLALIMQRPAFSINTLALSLIAVLIISPLSVLSAGFWLSYLAVCVIALVTSARTGGRQGRMAQWFQGVRVQWLIALSMLPISVILFQQGSLVSPVANMLVIPLVTLCVVPLAMLGSVASVLSTDLAVWIFTQTGHVLSLVWGVLEILIHATFLDWYRPQIPLSLAALSLFGALLLLLPRGFPMRFAGALMLLPMVLYQPERPEKGGFWLTVLDVGQGLSILIQTQHKALLYDTGARFSERFDIGERVILPYLRYAGVQALDILVISHADNDHAGGVASILSEQALKQLRYGEWLPALDKSTVPAQYCRAGERWQWQGVNFEFLHPIKRHNKSNNNSCVLKVWNRQYSVLLTGDIERKVETQLHKRIRQQLLADVLIVPHHGSNTSSSQAWLDAVEPELAIVSAGYKNRFRHPTQKVTHRYRQMGTSVLNTAYEGAIQLKFSPGSVGGIPVMQLPKIHRQRKVKVHYWNHRP